jgi:hypothetical protein
LLDGAQFPADRPPEVGGGGPTPVRDAQQDQLEMAQALAHGGSGLVLLGRRRCGCDRGARQFALDRGQFVGARPDRVLDGLEGPRVLSRIDPAEAALEFGQSLALLEPSSQQLVPDWIVGVDGHHRS